MVAADSTPLYCGALDEPVLGVAADGVAEGGVIWAGSCVAQERRRASSRTLTHMSTHLPDGDGFTLGHGLTTTCASIDSLASPVARSKV